MLHIAKKLLDVVTDLFGLSDKLRAAAKDRRERMHALFLSVSDCLAHVSAETGRSSARRSTYDV